MKLFRGDADLDAFAFDNFPGIHNSWTLGMEREQKITILIRDAPPSALAEALESYSPGVLPPESVEYPAVHASLSPRSSRGILWLSTGLVLVLAVTGFGLYVALSGEQELQAPSSNLSLPQDRDDLRLLLFPGSTAPPVTARPRGPDPPRSESRPKPRVDPNANSKGHPGPPPEHGNLVIVSMIDTNVEIAREGAPIQQWQLVKARDVVRIPAGKYLVTCWRKQRIPKLAVERTVEVKPNESSIVPCYPD